jgi:dihydroorotate dehydrogenase (fumarate)
VADLRTRWLGLDLAGPVVVGAGPLGNDLTTVEALVAAGAGAVVLPSLFEEQLVHEQLGAHHFLDAYVDATPEARSFLPDSDVFSLGAEGTLAQLQRLKATVDVPVIASLNGVTPGGWTSLAGELAAAGADAVELNLYDVVTDPAVSSAEVEARQLEVVAAVVAAVPVPVTVKLSATYTSVPGFAAALARAGASGITCFNRFSQPDIDLDTLGLDRRLVLSTPAELPPRLHALALLWGKVPVDLACTGGVHSGTDAAKAILCGAAVVQTVSALLTTDRPAEALRRMISELDAWLDERGYRSVGEARGATAFDNVADPTGWERLNYARMLQGWTPRPSRG